MGGRILGDLCGAAGLYSRSGSIQQKAKRIHEFFTTGANLVAPSDAPESSHDYNSTEDRARRDSGMGDVNVRGHATGYEDFGADLQVGNKAAQASAAAQAVGEQKKSPSPVQAGDVEV